MDWDGWGRDGSGSLQEEKRAESNRDFGVVCVNIYTHDELPIYVHVCICFFVLSDYYYGHSLLTVAEVDDYLSVIIAEESEVFVPPSTLSLP